MPKPSFEELVRENEEDLQRIRIRYFPLIRDRIITGYNLYQRPFNYPKRRLFLNYLHSNLRPEDRHFKELFEKLKQEGVSLEGRILINSKLVDKKEFKERVADYRTEPDWKDSSNTRYFDFDGNPMPVEIAKSLGIPLIGEAIQHDLLIRIRDESELHILIDLFKRYVSKHQLGIDGKRILKNGEPKPNREAVYGASEVPLIIYTNTGYETKDLKDFLPIKEFMILENLGGVNIVLSTLVGKRAKQVNKILNKRKARTKVFDRYTLSLFVEDYVDK